MLQQWLFGTVTGKAMFVLLMTGILLRMITAVSYKKMKNAAENAGKTKKQWVQILKKRFDNYERFGRIRSVEAFVDHYFSRKGILGIPLAFWDRSVLFLSLAAAILGVGSSFYGYLHGNGPDSIWIPLYQGAVSSGILLWVHMMGATEVKKESIRAILTDYLANGISQKAKDGKEERRKEEVPQRAEVEAMSEAAVTEEEKQVLMEVLEDYFW